MQYFDISERGDNVIFCGDIHGEFEELVYKVVSQYKITDATVIVAGDCGFGFYKFNYYDDLYKKKLHRKLSKANVMLLMVRGNHDDPSYFTDATIDYPYWKAVEDYTVIHTPSHNILCVGGAISVDRGPRISKMQLDEILRKHHQPLYWEDEPVKVDLEKLKEIEAEGIKIDTVVTHSAPAFCPPFVKGILAAFATKDDTLEADVKKEREDLEAIYQWLVSHGHPLHSWFYGHFHDSSVSEKDGVVFHMLNIMELKALV